MATSDQQAFTTAPANVATDVSTTVPASTGMADFTSHKAAAPAASTGYNDPQISMYSGYRTAVGNDPTNHYAGAYTMSNDPAALQTSLGLNVFDPWGPVTRPEGGRKYQGPWVDPSDTTAYPEGDPRYREGDAFKYNQMLMTVAQNFDPFMQKKEMVRPHWWLNRIPRTAYKLFDGSVHETRLYRGGLSVYSGLSDWEDLAPDPTSPDACKSLPYRTYQYAWETRAWSGKKTAWGSDPICLDIFKFTPHAIEQLGWILETGVKFGTDIQNIWNRDMFIYHTVMARRSFVMTSNYRGGVSPRYVYEPYCKFDGADDAQTGMHGTELHANPNYVKKPFVVIDARQNVEPLNFDVLDMFRKQLERQCPEAAVGRKGNALMFGLAASEDDVWNYIRGNEELRKYYIEADPQALIDGWISPTTFKRWVITCDNDQLRFKYVRRIEKYTLEEASAYGYVGAREFNATASDGIPVYIAEAVDPEYAARPGVNGAPVPEANPEYDLAELAIAPVFMNHVYTNQFVPDVTNLGHGTWFGPKKGLNGRWGWFNPQTKENLEQKVGNFYGIFEIVPKPELNAIYATSFIYRRCAEPLPSLCPAENPRINNTAVTSGVTVSGNPNVSTDATTGVSTATVVLSGALLGASTGDGLTLTKSGKSVDAVILSSLSGTRKLIQLDVDPVSVKAYAANDLVVSGGKVYYCSKAVETYSSSKSYATNDLVVVAGDSVTNVYKALQTASGKDPTTETTYWSLVKPEAGTATTAGSLLTEAFTELSLDGATVAHS